MARVKYSRRPLEYVLYTVLVLLIGFAFWSLWQINKQDKEYKTDKVEQLETGTPAYVGSVVESTIESEEAVHSGADDDYDQYLNELDASANNMGGVYDETTY